MDAEIPELGPGAEPADFPVWGTAHRIPVKRKAGVAALFLYCHSSEPYSIGICIISRNSQSYSGGRVYPKGRIWAAPTGFPIIQKPFLWYKKSNINV